MEQKKSRISIKMAAEGEVFLEMYEDQLSRIFIASISLICSILTLPYFYGVIYYEKNGPDTNRTVISKLTSSFFIRGILWIVTVQIPEALFYIHPPKSKFLCMAQNVCKRSLLLVILLVSDAIVVLR